MKPADIKKLKVPELRSKLRELGLDSAGLKAELVGRLWSFLESRQSAENGEKEVKLQDETSPTPTETVDLSAPSSPPSSTEAGVTPRCDTERTKEFTDTATQTETDVSPPKPQQNPELVSTSVPVHRVDGEEAETEQRGAAGGPEVEERGRGRAFYEFKEEIRYKR